jgi:hypothetical protein
MDDTAKVLAIILLASFAIERIVAGAEFLFDFISLLTRKDAKSAELQAAALRKLIFVFLGGMMALLVVYMSGIRVLRLLYPTNPPDLDFWLTSLVVFAGADRLRDIIGGGGWKPAPEGGADGKQVVRIQIRDGEIRELSQAN